MPAAYATAREHLDEITQLVERMLERSKADDERMLAELELDVARREELIAARCEATAIVGPRTPLDRLRVAFGLSPTETRVLWTLAALELSPRNTTAPTIGLLEALVYRARRTHEAIAEEMTDDGRLFAYSLAELGDAQSWLARPVRVARRVLELALGRVRLDVEVSRFATLVEQPPDGDQLLVERTARETVAEVLQRRHAPIPLVAGPTGAGRNTLVLGACAALKKGALVVRAAALPRAPVELSRALAAAKREAVLFDSVLVVRNLDALSGDAERSIQDLVPIAADALASHHGPVAVTAHRNVWPPTNRRAVVVVELGVPAEAARTELWLRALGDRDLATQAASRFRVTGGIIERVAATARELAGSRAVVLDDLRVGVRNQLDADLATLGRRVEWQQTWADLVIPDDIRDELVELIARVRHRRHVLDDWGFARKVAKGVGISALFSGPPGTGKTMVAGLVAGELGLDLYQIDVSRMVSKWVGETEKNLARLFDAASAGHVVLLFDEADSLFAKRTEVKSSNDRYANLEVNYLLQRMEEFDGITILTTNLETSIDDAFKRRLAFRIKFPVPEISERAQLWRTMIPQEAQLASGIDFRSLAERFEMTGGYIRNAVLRAAYLAAAEGSAIGMQHLQRAATLEYTAMGKIMSL